MTERICVVTYCLGPEIQQYFVRYKREFVIKEIVIMEYYNSEHFRVTY